jgi:hypothetical protein
VINYGAAYGPAGAAVAGGVFGASWFGLLAAGMAVVRALCDNPGIRDRPTTLAERLVALDTWQKGVAGVACGLFLGALIMMVQVSVDPQFATEYLALSKHSVPGAAIPSDSQAFDPSTAKPLTIPSGNSAAQSAEDAQYNALVKLIPDYDSIRQPVIDWVKQVQEPYRSRYLAIVNSGTPEQVAGLVSIYRQYAARAAIPSGNSAAQSAEDAQYNALVKLIPDYDSIRQPVIDWVKHVQEPYRSRYLAIVNSGTPEQVTWLVSVYRQYGVRQAAQATTQPAFQGQQAQAQAQH